MAASIRCYRSSGTVRLSLSLLVTIPLVFSDYGGLFLRRGSDEVRQMIMLASSEFNDLASAQFLLYTEEGTVSDYFVGVLRFEHVGGGILLWLLSTLPNILSHFRFYKVAERMPIDPGLVALAFHPVPEIDCSLSAGSEGFVSHDFAICTVRECPSKEAAPEGRKKVDDGLAMKSWRLL